MARDSAAASRSGASAAMTSPDGPALLDALDRLGRDPVRGAPPAPGAHDRGVRVDEDAVEVGEDRRHAATVCGSRTTAEPPRA